MLDYLVHHFLVTVEGEVVALRGNVGLRNAETLCGTRTLSLAAVTLGPANKHVRQVVLRQVAVGKRDSRNRPELVL